jgi:hypothetical protein
MRFSRLLPLVMLCCPSLAGALNYGMLDRVCIGDVIVPPPILNKRVPIPIGCELVDCCPGCPGGGTLEWRINIDARMLTGAELRFEGLSPAELKQLRVDGGAKRDGDRILLGAGQSRIRGLPRRMGEPTPVGLLQPVASKESMGSMPAVLAKRKGRDAGLITDQIMVQQYFGSFVVNRFDWRFLIQSCIRPVKPTTLPWDTLNIQGIAAGDEVAVMMDARTQTQCRDGVGEPEWVFRSTGQTTFENLLSPTAACNSEIAIFSKKHAMKWETAVPWTDNTGDVRTAVLDPLIKADVHIWVADDATRAIAQQHIEIARGLFIDNMVGVEFVPTIRKLSDVPGAPANAFQIVKNGIEPVSLDCLALGPIQSSVFYTAKTLNVYYVDIGFTGKNCAIKQSPSICTSSATAYPPGDANITFLGSTATSTTLAHELGHAYGLRPRGCKGHTEGVPGFGPDNIMWAGGGDERTTFTLGQVFRMNTHSDDWGGSMLIPNNLPARIPRRCAPNVVSELCPALEVPWP